MEDMAAHVIPANKARLKTMLIPREHGAWGMMLVPLAVGAIVAAGHGVNATALMLFATAAIAVFWLRTPLEAWMGTSAIKAQTAEERLAVKRLSFAIAAIAAICGALLFAMGYARGLLLIVIFSSLAFAAQTAVKRLGRRGRMPAQMIGALGLTSTAAAAYYVATGMLDRTALTLWAANWLFAAGQIHFVQVRVHSARLNSFEQKWKQGRFFLIGQFALMAVLLLGIGSGLLPRMAALAFIPVLLRGTFWFVRGRQPLNLHRLGFTELAHALVFGALLCAAFLA